MIRRHRYRNLVELGEESCREFSERPLFGTRANGRYVWTSYGDFQDLVDALRGGLASVGVRAGDRVAIVSNNRLEWAVAAYATYGLGATFVPMYEAQLDKDWEYILRDSGAKVLLVATPAIYEKTRALPEAIPTLSHVVLLVGEGAEL